MSTRLFAPEVSEEDSFCGQLRQFLQESVDLRVEVINAAIPGGCPFRYLLQVRHGLSIAQPDLVLVHFDLSDIADTRAQRRFALLNKEGQTVTAIHPSFDARTPALTEPVEREFLAVELARKKLACWMQTRGKSSTQPTDWENPAGRYYWLHDNQPFREADQRVFQPLAELRNLLNDLSSSAVPLIVCTSPKPWQVSPIGGGERLRTAAGLPLNRQIDSTSVTDVLSDFCQTESVPLIDVSSRFRTAADRDDLFFDEAEALSPAGHQLYAQAVAQELRKRGLTLAR